jgi:hypothetical protein
VAGERRKREGKADGDMLMRKKIGLTGWSVLIFLWGGLILQPAWLMAQVQSDKEQQAAKLWTRVKAHLDREDELKAARLALKMAPFKGTQAYGKAQKALKARGLSIESPLLSWTAKALVRVQNVIEGEMQKQGNITSIGVLKGHTDAWGHPLRVELVHMGEYLYLIRSAGPDGKYMSGDDPIIGGLKPGMDGINETRETTGSAESRGYQNPDPSKGLRKDLLKTGGNRTGQGSTPGTGRAASRDGSDAPAAKDEDIEELKEDLAELEKLLEKK